MFENPYGIISGMMGYSSMLDMCGIPGFCQKPAAQAAEGGEQEGKHEIM